MALDAIDLIVNAGGLSQRMGRMKALLPVPPDDTPLIVHVMRRLAPLVRGKTIVVTNDPQTAAVVQDERDVFVVPDQWAEGGALGGIATALTHCTGWAMVVACDMPLVSPVIFAQLLDEAARQKGCDAVIPRIAAQAQPFHGLWHRRGLPTLEAQLDAGALAVQAALARMRVVWMEEEALGSARDEPAFYNVNTPAEWVAARAMLADQSRPIA